MARHLDTEKLRADAVPASPLWGDLQKGRDVTLADGRVIKATDYLLPPPRARRIVVAGDNDQPELLATAAHGADVLVHEATYTEDVLQKISDPLLTQCPQCGQSTYAKQVTAAGFQLKGSGWYVTDFRGGDSTSGAGAAGASSTASGSAASAATPAPAPPPSTPAAG